MIELVHDAGELRHARLAARRFLPAQVLWPMELTCRVYPLASAAFVNPRARTP